MLIKSAMVAPPPPECILLERHPLCVLLRSWSSKSAIMPLCVVRHYLKHGVCVGLFVEGWKEPWLCFLVEGAGEEGELHAQCPTAHQVAPRVVQVVKDGKSEDWKVYL